MILKKESIDKSVRHNKGKLNWSLVDFKSIEPMVRVLEFGKKKYSRDNWKIGLDLDEIIDSTLRHLTSLSDGEIRDKETGELHAGHVLCNMMFWIHHYNKQNKENELG